MIWNRVQKRDQWGLKKYRERPESEWLRRDAPALRIISDELWEAAQARLQRARDTYVRGPRGRLIARPSLRDLDTPYLLSGLARCAACGGPLASVTRDFKAHGRRRYYECAYSSKRGSAVCKNRLLIRQERLDAAVLAALRGRAHRPPSRSRRRPRASAAHREPGDGWRTTCPARA